MKLKPYSSYKDSGVDWIGTFSSNWNTKKIKHFSNCVAGGTPDTKNPAYWDGNIPWLPSGMVHDNPIYEKDVETFITLDGVQNSSTKWIKKDSVLIALTGATCANIAYLTFRATANQSVIGIECDKFTNSKFIFYYLLSQREQILINQTGGAQAGINKEDVKNLICTYPDKELQTKIAVFLDDKISELDQTLEKNKRLIELHQEKRTALINHVVTKGLDPKVKLKDSGIEWIGKIPENWKFIKLKHHSYIKGRIGWQGLKAEEFIDEGPFLVTGMHFDEKGVNWDSCYHISEERYHEAPEIQLRKGDLLVTKDGTIGKVAYIDNLPGPASLNSHLLVIRPLQNKYLNKYLYWVLQSCIFTEFVENNKIGTTFFGITQEQVEKFKFYIPSINEQTEMVDYLDKQTYKIDETIKKINHNIELLEEYKKSLIHHVVTGKVDVRGA